MCAATCHAAAPVRDYVGYGSATDFEGAGAAPAPSNTTAALRARGADSDDNRGEFTDQASDHDPQIVRLRRGR